MRRAHAIHFSAIALVVLGCASSSGHDEGAGGHGDRMATGGSPGGRTDGAGGAAVGSGGAAGAIVDAGAGGGAGPVTAPAALVAGIDRRAQEAPRPGWTRETPEAATSTRGACRTRTRC